MLSAAVPACARLGRAGSSAAAGGARPPGCGWSKRHHSRIARVTFAASIVPVASCLGSGERKQSRTSEVARGRAAATAPAAGAPRPRGVSGEQDSGRAGREHLRADDVARGGAGGKRGCERPASGFYPASERGSERERAFPLVSGAPETIPPGSIVMHSGMSPRFRNTNLSGQPPRCPCGVFRREAG